MAFPQLWFSSSSAMLATMMILNGGYAAGQTPPLPPHHPLVKFSPHFRCPYAKEWITKGPHQAAIDLGIVPKSASTQEGTDPSRTADSSSFPTWTTTTTIRGSHRRGLQDNNNTTIVVLGHCTFTNAWTGQPTCMEFRGDFSQEEMQTRCAQEPDSTLTDETGCMVMTDDETVGLVGWCFVNGDGKPQGTAVEATPMMGDCTQNEMACTSFMNGSFQPMGGGACGDTDNVTEDSQSSNATIGGDEDASSPPYEVPAFSEEPVTCRIAPGAIGAGHQAGYSMGYSSTCPDTPAEGSPYMWPMAWRAQVESKSMAFGSDDIWYHSKGIVSYRLDKNWKRQDWYYQRGVQRGIGQAPCDPEDIDVEFSDGPLLACRRNSDEYSTMIHRGSKMFFISWKNGTEVGSSDPANIVDCNYLDLQVIGNIRPDWFMDDRGDSTDVQYLGNQHVFHDGEPRLVKQWRKKDFANQYFVMSMLGNPKQDGIHWPMTLNVPGEGFGDDFLQIYTNQTLLTDDDDYLFLLEEALAGIGGSCPQMGGFGEDGAGPPTNSDVHIPSNLEVDPNAWFSNVYTFSPVWQPEVAAMNNTSSGSTGVAVTEADRVTVKSCFDDQTSSVRLSVEYKDIELVGPTLTIPWMALGFRESEECLMTPRSGADTPIVLIMDSGDGGPQAYSGSLPAVARSGTEAGVASVYPTLTALEDSDSFSDANLQGPSMTTTATSRSDEGLANDSVLLEFSQSVDAVPNVMYLMYAIGSQPTLGFHATRNCFEVTEFPICPADGVSSNSANGTVPTEAQQVNSAASSAVVSFGVVSAMAATTSFWSVVFLL